MKNLFILMIGLATAFSNSNAQNSATTSINLDLEEITSVGLSVDAVLTISEGKAQKVTIEGPQDLIDDITTDVDEGSWNIKYERHKSNRVKDQLRIDIQVKTLKNLAISGQGTIRGKGRFSKVSKRNIAISGMGSLSFQGDAEEINIALSGTGDMDIDCNSDYMNVALSGTGDIKMKGSTNYVVMAASGSGNMGGKDLKTKRCKATISGSSILAAEVTEDLDLQISGSGQFKYSGNPTIHKKVDRNSQVKKM